MGTDEADIDAIYVVCDKHDDEQGQYPPFDFADRNVQFAPDIAASCIAALGARR